MHTHADDGASSARVGSSCRCMLFWAARARLLRDDISAMPSAASDDRTTALTVAAPSFAEPPPQATARLMPPLKRRSSGRSSTWLGSTAWRPSESRRHSWRGGLGHSMGRQRWRRRNEWGKGKREGENKSGQPGCADVYAERSSPSYVSRMNVSRAPLRCLPGDSGSRCAFNAARPCRRAFLEE